MFVTILFSNLFIKHGQIGASIFWTIYEQFRGAILFIWNIMLLNTNVKNLMKQRGKNPTMVWCWIGIKGAAFLSGLRRAFAWHFFLVLIVTCNLLWICCVKCCVTYIGNLFGIYFVCILCPHVKIQVTKLKLFWFFLIETGENNHVIGFDFS